MIQIVEEELNILMRAELGRAMRRCIRRYSRLLPSYFCRDQWFSSVI